MSFLFGAALWALPLAGLPLLLHLLFRRKTPIIPFSTLRFIRISVQQTAARKKLQRWLLLACRVLLLALLIWAVAQPARQLASGWLSGGGDSTAAAVVVDTSYSMLLQDGSETLLHKAQTTVDDLLANELRDANVAIYQSRPAPASDPERLRPASDYRGEHHVPLIATPVSRPLSDRVNAAAEMLLQSGASRKWLIVISDGQIRDFPHPLPTKLDFQTLMIELRASDPRADAVVSISTQPQTPRLGIPAQVSVQLRGTAQSQRAVHVTVSKPQAPLEALVSPPVPMAQIAADGRGEVEAPLTFNHPSWLLVSAALDGQDPLPWAATRQQLVRIPERQRAAILDVGSPTPSAHRMVQLALDPSEGEQADWPLSVSGAPPRWDEAMVVALCAQWPRAEVGQRMADFARNGGTLVLFLQPGLEGQWDTLPPSQKEPLAALLAASPSGATATLPSSFRAVALNPADPAWVGVDHAEAAARQMVITRLLPFDHAGADAQSTPVLNAASADPTNGTPPLLLLARKRVGAGTVWTWATMPDRTCGNLRVSALFPPSLVNAAFQADAPAQEVNVDAGQPMELSGAGVDPATEIDLTPPSQRTVKVDRTVDGDGAHYRFTDTSEPGLYAWRAVRSSGDAPGGGDAPAADNVIAWTNVQIPSGESLLKYRTLAELAPPGANVLAGNSLEQIRALVNRSQEPQPRWSIYVALVLLLLCLEALIGSTTTLWKPLKSYLPHLSRPSRTAVAQTI